MSLAKPSRTIVVEPVEQREQAPPPPEPPRRDESEPQPAKT
jgi:hypothetical protein